MKTGSSSQSSTNISFVTLMHMAPYSTPTEVYFNGDKKTNSISPGTFSTTYGQVPPGIYDIKFKAAGKDSLLGSISSDIYDSLGFYTLILYNTQGGVSTGAVKINDDFKNLSQTGANYRFFNLCPDAPSVDLYIGTTKAQPGRTVADNAGSPYYNTFVPITAGGYTLQARKAGSDSVIATASSVNLIAGAAYTIFLSGSSKTTLNTPVTLNVLQAAY